MLINIHGDEASRQICTQSILAQSRKVLQQGHMASAEQMVQSHHIALVQ